MYKRSRLEKLIFHPPPLGSALYLPGLPGGGSTIYDRSPYGNNGTITGAAWKRPFGGLCCLDCDGIDDYVNCGSGPALYPATGTIIMWVLNKRGNGDTPFFHIFKDNNNWMYLGQSGPTIVTFAIRKSGTWYAPTIANPDTTSFHLWAGVFDGSNLTLYLDGEAKQTIAGAGVGLDHLLGNSVYLGRWFDGSNYAYHKGLIGQVLLCARPFSSIEVMSHYLATRWMYR